MLGGTGKINILISGHVTTRGSLAQPEFQEEYKNLSSVPIPLSRVAIGKGLAHEINIHLAVHIPAKYTNMCGSGEYHN